MARLKTVKDYNKKLQVKRSTKEKTKYKKSKHALIKSSPSRDLESSLPKKANGNLYYVTKFACRLLVIN